MTFFSMKCLPVQVE